MVIISLYVDDLLVTGSNFALIEKVKSELKKAFDITNLEKMQYFLGIEIHQTQQGIFVCQRKYDKEVSRKFNMENCKPVSTPLIQNAKLMKEDGLTRLDITFVTNMLSRFRQEPSKIHFQAAKRVLRYIKGTEELGIWFRKSEILKLIGFTDSDWAGSSEDMKSTSGYVFYVGSSVICWNSIKQKIVAQSTAEAEYIATSEATNQALWLKKVL
ncbi:uncharacterized protein LOC111397855 [Olea europaea var. sylvestris]|uniref:uncharacterized protein LOC111397855 n=1 Tax=Olea europaea var. sylvestris TaxID=158386 RepID=UPI000C1D6D4C|nr:uncharacterized protein LOC111397855 [Olea europaea var. sylvestris]